MARKQSFDDWMKQNAGTSGANSSEKSYSNNTGGDSFNNWMQQNTTVNPIKQIARQTTSPITTRKTSTTTQKNRYGFKESRMDDVVSTSKSTQRQQNNTKTMQMFSTWANSVDRYYKGGGDQNTANMLKSHAKTLENYLKNYGSDFDDATRKSMQQILTTGNNILSNKTPKVSRTDFKENRMDDVSENYIKRHRWDSYEKDQQSWLDKARESSTSYKNYLTSNINRINGSTDFSALNREDAQELLDLIEKQKESTTNKYNSRYNAGDIFESRNSAELDTIMSGYDSAISKLQRQIATDQVSEKYEALKSNPDYKEKSKFVQKEGSRYNNADPNAPVKTEGLHLGAYLGNNINRDTKYYAINGNRSAQIDLQTLNGNNFDFDKYFFMTEDEKSMYNYLYNTQGESSADEYLSSIERKLNFRQATVEREATEAIATKDPFGSSLYSVVSKPGEIPSYVAMAAEKLAGGEIDENAPQYRKVREIQGIRNKVAANIEGSLGEKWGKWGSFGYQTLMSMADSTYNSLITGAGISAAAGEVSAIAENVSLLIMGTEAAAESVMNLKQQGYDDDRAFTLGTLGGVAEIVTEKVSLDNFLETVAKGKGSFVDLVKQIVAEASEEGASDLINWAADDIYSATHSLSESEFKQNVREYMSQGISEKDAVWRVIVDRAKELGLDMLGGGISGGMMGGGAVAFNTSRQLVEGYQAAITDGKVDTEAVNELIAAGLQLDPSTSAYKSARKLQNKLENGEGITKAEASLQHYRNVQGQIRFANREGIDFDEAVSRLNEMAEQMNEPEGAITSDRNDAVSTAETISNMQNEETGEETISAEETTEEKLTKVAENTFEDTLRDETIAAQDAFNNRSEQAQTRTEPSQIRAKSNETRNSSPELRVFRETRSAEQIERDVDNIFKLADILDKDGRKAFSTALLRMYDQAAETIPAGTYVSVMQKYYQAGNTDLEYEEVTHPMSGYLTEEMKKAAYLAGEADQMKRLEEAAKLKLQNAEGTSVFDKDLNGNAFVKATSDSVGVVDNEVVRSITSPALREQITQANDAAKRLGLQITYERSSRLFNGNITGNKMVIYLDNAQNSLRAVMGHETLHYIKSQSETAYEEFKSAVLGAMPQEEFDALVDRTIESYKRNNMRIERIDAEEEVIADYAGTLFENRDVLDRFINQNVADGKKSVLERMHDVAKRFLNKLKGSKNVEMVDNVQHAVDVLAKALKDVADKQEVGPDTVESITKDSRKFYDQHLTELQNKYDKKEANIDLDTLLNRYKAIVNMWDELGGELNSQFLNEWNEKSGTDRAFTVFKAQSGYKYNIELSSMCKKGVALFEAIDTIVKQEAMKKLNTDTIGKEEKEILYDILKAHSFEIPCAICYVEQARQREGNIIKAFLNGNEEGKIGWNQALHDIENRMKEKGVEYKFPSFDRSIGTDSYVPTDVVMDERTQQAYYEALLDATNDYIDEWNNNVRKKDQKKKEKLTKATPQEVNQRLKGSQPLNLIMYKALFNESQSRALIDEDLLYSSMTTHNLAAVHNKLYSLFNQQGGTGGYKTKQSNVVYWGDILGKKYKTATVRREGGIRNQSNSDFQMYTFLDQVQMYMDFSAKGYYLQAYTKTLTELKLFGLSKAKINASLIPRVYEYKNADGSIDIAKTQENAGLDQYGNLLFDDVEGIPHEEAFMLIEDPEYSKNICGICIGYSDKHISRLLDDPRVQMIIGFHDNTNDPDKRYRGARYSHNYNGENEAVNLKTGKTVHVGFNQYIIQAEKMFTKKKRTVDYNGKTYQYDDIPKLAAALYLEKYDVEGKYSPAYPKFKKHENYYKLLADFGLYDSEGHYAPHQKVEFNLPDTVPYLQNGIRADMSTKDYIKKKLGAELKVRDEIAEAMADTSANGIIPQFIKRVNEQTKYSLKDSDYMAAVNSGDMETAQRMVDEAAEDAGYTIKAFHGTANAGRFNIFDPKKLNNSKLSSHIGQGFYFTNSKEGALEYTKNVNAYGQATKGTNPYLFEGYIKLENPIEIDTNSHNLSHEEIKEIIARGNKDWFFNSGIAHELQNKDINGEKYSKDQLKQMSKDQKIDLYAQYLYQYGDQAALSNMVDAFSYDSQDKLLEAMKNVTGHDGIHWQMKQNLDQFVVFDSSQFKESAPVTYDDNGNVIPLSERFNSKNSDIRYSLKDSEGNNLTKAQIDFYKESKARDDDGNLLKLYTGTSFGGFTQFKEGKIWLTTVYKSAKAYGGAVAGNVFAPDKDTDINSHETISVKKRVEVPTTSSDKDSFYFDSQEDLEEFEKKIGGKVSDYMDYWELSDYEYEADNEDYEKRKALSEKIEKEYAAYNRTHAKNTVIADMLKNPDAYLRSDFVNAWYSFDSNASIDEDGLDSKESLVEGLIDVYEENHEEGESIDDFFGYTTLARIPEGTSSNEADYNDTHTVYAMYANVTHPYIVDNGHLRLNEKGSIYYPSIDYAWDNRDKYDGVIIKDVEVGPGGSGFGTTVVAFSPEQVKSVNNTEPTSNPDIRYSLKDDQQYNLIAVHGTNESKLLKALQLEGLPGLSTAVFNIDNGIANADYGEISLVFDKNTIDPTRPGNAVYGADIWSPTQYSAQVERQIDNRKVNELDRKIVRLASGIADGIFSNSTNLGGILYSGSDATTEDAESLSYRFDRNDTMMAAYLADQGKTIEPVMMPKSYNRSFDNEALDYILELYKDESNPNGFKDSLLDLYMHADKNDMTAAEKSEMESLFVDVLVNQRGMKQELAKKLVKNHYAANIERETYKLLDSVLRYDQDGRPNGEEIDRAATSTKMYEEIGKDREAYHKWIADQITEAGVFTGEEGLYNKKDRLTNSGRKSFKQTHVPITAENIVKLMNKDEGRGLNYAGHGAAGVQALTATKYKTIEDIRADMGRLQNLDEEDYKNLIAEYDEKLNDLVTKIAEYNDTGTYAVSDAFKDAAKGKRSISSIQKAYAEYDYKISPNLIRESQQLYNEVAQIPSKYFEAKASRVIGFDEIKMAVIPDSSSNKLVDALQNKNIPYEMYEAGNDQDRLNIIRGLDNVRFSLKIYDEEDVSKLEKGNEILQKENTRLAEKTNTQKETIKVLTEQRSELEKEKNELIKTIKEQNKTIENYKQQFKRTERAIDPKAFKREFKKIIKDFSGTINADDYFNGFYEVANEFQKDPENTWGDLNAKAIEIANKIVETAQEFQEFGPAHEVRQYLKDKKIPVSAKIKADIPDYNALRQSYMGKVTLTTQSTGQTMEELYEELKPFGENMFPDTTSPTEMLFNILEAVSTDDRIFANPYDSDRAAAIDCVTNALLTQAMEPKFNKLTYADKTAKVIEREQKKYDQMKHNNKVYYEQIVENMLRDRETSINEVKKYYQNKEAQRRDAREYSEASQVLLKMAKRLNKLSSKTTEFNQAKIKEVLGTLDLVSTGITGRKMSDLVGMKMDYDNRIKNDPDYIPDKRTENELTRLANEQINGKPSLLKIFSKQADAAKYKAEYLKDHPDEKVSISHVEDTYQVIKYENRMTLEDIISMINILRNIEEEISNHDRTLETADRRDIWQQGSDSIDAIEKSAGKSGFKLGNVITTETLRPSTEMLRIVGYDRNAPLYQRYLDLEKGQRTMLDYQRRAYSGYFDRFLNNSKLVKGMTKGRAIEIKGFSIDGSQAYTLKITPDMLMSLYMHSFNNENMRHIAEGGVEVPDYDLYMKGRYSDAADKFTKITMQRSYIRKLAADNLTAEELAFCEAAKSYYRNMSKPEINRASELLVGYPVAKVENYWRIVTDRKWSQTQFDQLKFDGTITGEGWQKERVYAKNPIVLLGFSEQLKKDVEAHSRYVGMAIPIRNFNKVYGVTRRSFDDQGNASGYESSVQIAIRQKWGEQANDYIAKMMTDIQNPQRTSDVVSKFLGKMRGNYAAVVLNLNASVAIKQAASYPTAAAEIGWEPLFKALATFPKTKGKSSEFISQYSPLMRLRTEGYGNVDLADIKSRNKQMPKALNWIQMIDVGTVRLLWLASEYYVRSNTNLQVGSEEYYQEVGRVHTRVIEATQPNYSALQRPQALRADTDLYRTLMMFKTQPFQNFNILYESVGNWRAASLAYKNNPNTENKQNLATAQKRFAWAVSSQLVSSFVFALMQYAWDAFRKKDDKYKDKDGNQTFLTWLKGMGINMAGNGAGMIPFGSQIFEFGEAFADTLIKMFSGETFFDAVYYGVDTGASTDLINDLVKTILKIPTAISKVVSGIKGDDNNWPETIRGLVKIATDALQYFGGIPMENIEKTLVASAKTILPKVMGEYYGTYKALDLAQFVNDDKKKEFYKVLQNALNNDEEQYKQIYDEIIKNPKFKTKANSAEKNVNTNMRSLLKEEVIKAFNNDPEKYAKLKELIMNHEELFSDVSKGADYYLNDWTGDIIASSEERELGLTDEAMQQFLNVLATYDTEKPGSYKQTEVAPTLYQLAKELTDDQQKYLWDKYTTGDTTWEQYQAKQNKTSSTKSSSSKSSSKTSSKKTNTKTSTKKTTTKEPVKQEEPHLDPYVQTSSSVLAGYQYNWDNGELTVDLNSGGRYTYHVTPEVYQGLQNAESKGSYWSRYIR